MKTESNKHAIIERVLFERLVEIQREETSKIETEIGSRINNGISERIKPSKNIEK